MFCRKCGNEIPDDSIFCLKCGEKVETLEKPNDKISVDAINNEDVNETEAETTEISQTDKTPEVIDAEENEIDKHFSEEKQLEPNEKAIDDKQEELEEKKVINIKLSLRQKILIAVGVIVSLILIICCWQVSLVTTVKKAYDSGDYETAYNKYDNIWNKKNVIEYEQKINVMYHVDRYYQMWNEEKNDTGSFSMAETWAYRTLENCVGYSKWAKDCQCEKMVDSIAKEVAQWLANDNKDVENVLKKRYTETKYDFFPLSSEGNEQDVLNEISRICKMISKDEVTKVYNEKNPLKITKKDAHRDGNYWYCTGTVSNVGSSTRYYVKVRVTYYDNSNTVLTSDWTYAVASEGIRGGENQQFEIMTKADGNATQYKVEIMEYK